MVLPVVSQEGFLSLISVSVLSGLLMMCWRWRSAYLSLCLSCVNCVWLFDVLSQYHIFHNLRPQTPFLLFFLLGEKETHETVRLLLDSGFLTTLITTLFSFQTNPNNNAAKRKEHQCAYLCKIQWMLWKWHWLHHQHEVWFTLKRTLTNNYCRCQFYSLFIVQ